jgi:ATP-dependent Clp protease ATP-binding subunit ClpC
VGKTLLAKALAKFMFGSEDALLQIDMSEYMEKHNVSRLVGAPPGYVGFEEGGQLTEKVRRRPYSVVLFDEIEKAHHDVFNMLLQIMEEGRLTDSFGRNVDFRNTVLILTSNIGTSAIKNQATLGFTKSDDEVTYEKIKEGVLHEVQKYFKPEFLNRLDDVIVFRPLTEDNLKDIIDIEMVDVRHRLEERGIHLYMTDEAKARIIHEGTDLDLGARPLRRALERLIEDPLAEELLKGSFKERPHVTLRVVDDALDFQTTEEPPEDVEIPEPPVEKGAEEETTPEEVKTEG